MPRANLLRSSFAYGELSPRMLGRVDLRAYYAQGLRECVNWIPDKTGSMRYRGGTQHSYTLGANRAYRLVPFDVNGQPAVLALNTAGARVYYAPRSSGSSRTYTPSYRVVDENQRSDTSMFDWQVNGVAGASVDPAGFSLLTAQSNQVAVGSLSESILASLQWKQRPFYQLETIVTSIVRSRNASRDLDGLPPATFHITGDGSTIWISDFSGDRLVAYRQSDLTRDAAKDFDNLAADNTSPYGIWTDGITMWVLDGGPNRIFAYNVATKTRDVFKEIPLSDDNVNPLGMWGDGTNIWVSDAFHDRLFAYRIVSQQRDQARDFTNLINAGNRGPHGIWSDGITMWVADGPDDKLYAYNMRTTLHDPERDIEDLDASNTSPTGIWRHQSTLWVLDAADDKLYAYTYTETTTVTTESPVFSIYLFHPEIDPLLATWDPVANTLAVSTDTADVLNDPPLVGNRVAAGTFFEQRLAVGGGERFPQSIVGSRTPSTETGQPRFADWELIDNTLNVPTVFASHAFAYTMFSDIAIRIRWLANYAETVFIGCDHALYIARELAPDTPPIIRLHSIIGTASVQPAVAPFGIIYVSVDRSRVYEAFSKRDLTAHAEHLFESDPIKELAWSQNPVQRLWVLTASGKLFVLTISQENGVLAWSRIEFGRSVVVKSIAVGNGTDPGDTLWLAAERDGTVNLEALREPDDGEQMDRCYLDSSSVSQTTATGGVAGLSHLADVADVVVARIADRRDERQETQEAGTAVSAGGALDTDFDGEAVRVGLPYTASLELPTLAILPGGGGSAFGQPQRVAKATVGRYRSYGGMIGQHRDLMSDVNPADVGADLQGVSPYDLGRTLTIHDFLSDFESALRVEQTEPQPFNLLYLEMEINA